jgi:predicted RNase H-like nuclease (RuvC/YqgF family)
MDEARKASDAAHRRIDEVDRRVVKLEAKLESNDKKLDEVRHDVKELHKLIHRSSFSGGATGGGSVALAFIAWQLMQGGM